jgi:dihydroxyacetone kinase
MKKLINQPADVVKEALQGMALAYPDSMIPQLACHSALLRV